MVLLACQSPAVHVASPTAVPRSGVHDLSSYRAQPRDAERTARQADGPAAEVFEPAVDAQVTVDDTGTISMRSARAGLRGTTTLDPLRTDAMVAPVREKVAQLLDRPLVLRFEDQELPLTRADIAPLLSIRGSTLGIDAQATDGLARLVAAELHRSPVNARFDWNGGDLEILRTSRVGRDLDIALTAQRLTSALINETRTVDLPVQVVEPAVSSADPSSLGIVELIDRGSTSFAGSVPEKKTNIALAARLLNGVVVPPHGTFSFNDEIGPTTLEAGFEWGFAITGGADGPRTVPSVAGGICQVATTLFQPVFWAGYPLEERYAHGYWIPGYSSRGVVGLDVTVDGDAGLDFRWSNPTDDYVLIQSAVSGESVQFALYGRKPAWDVSVGPAVVSNERPADPAPVREEDSHLPFGKSLQVSAARDGFDVQVTRVVTPLEGDARSLRVSTSYQPSRNVTLVGTG
jgi:vancomycin resistance protein YoaR